VSGSKSDLEARAMEAYDWDDLLSSIFKFLEWWQLMFLCPLLRRGCSKKDIRKDETRSLTDIV